MGPETDPIDLDRSARDITILKARIKHPTASLRELQRILDEEYGIALSHNRINEILREMKSEGLFDIVGLPKQNLFEYYLFRLSFHHPTFRGRWEDCYAQLQRDPHVILFFDADAYHQWQFITQFRSAQASEEWKMDFFNKHHDVIAEFERIALPRMHKFDIDHTIFDDVLQDCADNDEYLE